MCDAKTIKAINEGKALVIKKWHMILTLVLIVFSNFAFAITWKTTTDITVQNHEGRLVELEKEGKSNHDLLLEIKFNLKSLIESQGFKYQKVTGSIK